MLWIQLTRKNGDEVFVNIERASAMGRRKQGEHGESYTWIQLGDSDYACEMVKETPDEIFERARIAEELS